MQHPIMHKPISELTSSEQSQAYELLDSLVEASMDNSCTQIDYIQISRLHYALGELAYEQCDDPERIIKYFLSSLHSLEKGGVTWGWTNGRNSWICGSLLSIELRKSDKIIRILRIHNLVVWHGHDDKSVFVILPVCMTEVANRQMACESSLFGLSPREDTQLIPYGYPLAFFSQYHFSLNIIFVYNKSSRHLFFSPAIPILFLFSVFSFFFLHSFSVCVLRARISRACEYNKVYLLTRSRAHSTLY